MPKALSDRFSGTQY